LRKNTALERTDRMDPGLIALLLAAFFAVLNETSINIALSNFSGIFHVSVSTIQWLTSGFLLVMTVILPTTAFIIQSFTTRQIFFASMSLVGLGAIIAGAAPAFWVLLLGRLIQAAGTCVLIALLNNVILVLTPPHKHGSALGLSGLVVLFAPAIAPTLSGFVMQQLSWRFLFWWLIPLYILVAVLAYINLKNVSETSMGKLDWLSLLLSIVAFGGILRGISSIGVTGFNIYALMPLLIGMAGLALFAWRQTRIEKPLLDLQVFKYPMFTLGTLMIAFCLMTLFGVVVLVPMFLQGAYGLSIFVTGLAMLPGGLLNGLAAPISGRIFDKVGPKPLIIPGIILMMGVSWLLSMVSNSTNIGLFIAMHCCMLISIAFVITPAQTNGLKQLSPPLYPHGIAIMSTVMQLAGALGTATYVSIMSVNQQYYMQHTQAAAVNLQRSALIYGINHAFQFCTLLLIVGLVIALFIKRPLSAENCSKDSISS